MADMLFFQDLFTDNTKMPKKIGCRFRHYWQMITVNMELGACQMTGSNLILVIDTNLYQSMDINPVNY